jgi:hypothetical protein
MRNLLSSLVLAIVYSNLCHGDVIVYEPFNYVAPGDLAGNGDSGSYGFSTNWNGDGTFDLASGSLVSPVSFPTSTGNRVTSDAFDGNRDIARTLSQPIGADNTTAFLSFLLRAEDTVGGGAYSGWFSFTLLSATGNLTTGKDSFSSKYKIESSAGHLSRSSVDIVANETHLMVIRADFLPGADQFRLYIDPLTGPHEPQSADAILNGFDLGNTASVRLSGPGAFGFDELRIGTSWLDVAPSYPGDYNSDGAVNAADYTVWRNTLGSTTDFRADGTGPGGLPDQVVDELDYAYWKQHYGENSSGATASGQSESIPEPTTLLLTGIALVASSVGVGRHRRRL